MRWLLLLVVSIVTLGTVSTRSAHAQKSCEYLVPPSGGAYEIVVHPAYLTGIQFPAKLVSANTSDLRDYEIRRDADTGLLLRPKSDKAQPANINVQSGTIRVSIGLRTVADPKEACALVTFRATTEEEALTRKIDEAVAAKVAALTAELDAMKKEQAARVRAEIDATLAERAMARLEVQRLTAVDRNDDGVVVWVLRAVWLGPDLLVNVEIENRSGDPFRVADLEVRAGDKNRATAARLAGQSAAGALVGTVAAGAKVRGVVVVREGAKLAGQDLTLVARTPDGTGNVTVRRLGIR